MKLYYLPLSTYSQKVVIAFYEKGVDFTPVIVDPSDAKAREEYKKSVNHFGKVPTLVLDNGHIIPESSIIIEYLEDHFGSSGTRLIPADKDRARQTRFHDRMMDLYFNDTMQTIFWDSRKPKDQQNPAAVAAAKEKLDLVFGMYDRMLEKSTWLMGDEFTMADCSAAPNLAYLKMVHPYEQHKNLSAYAARLMERPSFARVLTEAKPYLARMMGG